MAVPKVGVTFEEVTLTVRPTRARPPYDRVSLKAPLIGFYCKTRHKKTDEQKYNNGQQHEKKWDSAADKRAKIELLTKTLEPRQ